MGNILSSALLALKPVRSFLRGFQVGAPRLGSPRDEAVVAARAPQRARIDSGADAARRMVAQSRARSGMTTSRRTPLRVVRVVDGGYAVPGGRMRISGRMADVCAELDRMVERESALHARA